MKKWEYKLVELRIDDSIWSGLKCYERRCDVEKAMNQLGEEGWEVVSVSENFFLNSNGYLTALFKREKELLEG